MRLHVLTLLTLCLSTPVSAQTVEHVFLAREMGMSENHAVVLENGEPLTVSANGLRRENTVECGRVFVVRQ